METPLTPLEFARRARRLYADREAVVDGDLRLTYAQFFERCDRWSRVLQQPRRPARAIASPTSRPTRTRSSNRSTPSRSSARSSCRSTTGSPPTTSPTSSTTAARASSARTPTTSTPSTASAAAAGGRALRRARGRARRAGSITKQRLAAARRRVRAPGDRRDRSADDQLHQRHDVAAQGRDDHPPQRLHERRRHADPRADDAGRPLPVDAADVPRQRLDVRLDRHGRRRHARLPAKVEPAAVFELMRARADHDALRRADRAHRHRQRARGAPPECRAACAS